MTVFEELQWRGLIESITDSSLIDKINEGGLTFYIGTDPTGDSLHIGHLSSMLMAKRLKEVGHHPIILVGGGTGLIGDPRTTEERNVISRETLNYNYTCLKEQIERLFGFEMVNNYDWYKDLNFIDYLRDYGKFFNVNYMLDKETVKSRLEKGISYTEFSYMILQSIDFLHLYETKNCTLQIGGQDQWGNITSGLELIRKKHGDVECFGFTMPLITKADGTKFGKSEGGAIWLDKRKTSAYEMYQFLINSEDSKVIDYLKKLTFLTPEEIMVLEKSNQEQPELRTAHKVLAQEVITYLHGEEEYQKALQMSQVLFSGDVHGLSKEEIEMIFKDMPHIKIEEDNIVELLVRAGICTSKREAREFIASGSIMINGDKIMDENITITTDMAIDNTLLIVRRGKKKYYILSF